MKRELKFRAFSNGRMVLLDQITFTEKVWLCKGGNGLSIPYQPHRSVMQYTGLKDKNGVEIYEGDIISFENSMIPFRIKSSIVVWDDAMFSAKVKMIDQSLPIYALTNIKVLGNIHEHPELLNG